MIVADLDEVQLDLEVDGEQVREQLGRKVWEKGAWATVACAFRERAAGGTWKPAKLTILRFRKVHDAWKRESAVTLDGGQALELAAAVGGEWKDCLTSAP